MAKLKFLLTASSVALLAMPAIAMAQTAPQPAPAAAKDTGIVDIVVTATRQETRLQSTPLAITAITASNLESRGLKSVADLSQAVPNATFRKAQGAFGPGVTAFIRGIGQADTSLGSEPAVAYYVDDVYYPLLLGANFDLLDLDHIEVLRGPQGTLFGRNALAGAINIVSKQPSLTKASAFFDVTTGANQRIDVRAGFNMPLSDTVGIAVSGLTKQRDGYFTMLDFRCQMIKNGTPALAGNVPFSSQLSSSSNSSTPSDCKVGTLGGENVQAARAVLLWKPSASVKLTISGDWIRDHSGNPADKLVAVVGPGAANVASAANYLGVAYDNRFVTNSPYTGYASYADPIGSGTVIPGNSFYNGATPQRGGARFSPTSSVDQWGVSGKLVVGLTDHIDVTAVLGYRNISDKHGFDLDNSPLVVEETQLAVGEHYTNAELRLSGHSKLVDWVLGGFYFEGDGYTHGIIYSPQTSAYKIQTIAYSPLSKAVFGNATFKPLPRLDVTVGGRYSSDRKTVNFANVLDINATPGTGDTIFKVSPSASHFDWKLGAGYHATDSIMVYASAATGTRLPGYNTRPQQPSQVVSYDGDQTLAYEMGIKGDFFDRKLRVNLAGFYTDYKTRITSATGAEINMLTGAPQAGSQTVVPFAGGGAGATTCRAYSAATDGAVNPAGGVGVLCIPRTYFVNTPGKVKGFELEGEFRPIYGLTINGAVGYSHFTSPDLQLATRANDRLAGIPEINANAGIEYKADVAALHGTVTPRLDWFYTGSIAMSAARNTYNQSAYSLVNARITYANEDHNFTVSLGATNLFDKVYYHNYFVYQDIGYPNVEAQPGAPREWFLSLGRKF